MRPSVNDSLDALRRKMAALLRDGTYAAFRADLASDRPFGDADWAEFRRYAGCVRAFADAAAEVFEFDEEVLAARAALLAAARAQTAFLGAAAARKRAAPTSE